MTTPANAPQRTAASHHCCNRRASWPPSLSLGRKAALRIYITDAQIPELAEFPPEARARSSAARFSADVHAAALARVGTKWIVPRRRARWFAHIRPIASHTLRLA